MVDSQVALNSIWRRGGQILSSNDRVSMSISMVRPSLYRTTLRISPLSSTMDSGQYSCQSGITSDEYVLYTNAIQQEVIGIGGIYIANVVCMFVCLLLGCHFKLTNECQKE